MANLSSAYGYLHLDKKALDDIGDKIAQFIKEYEEPYYGVNYWEQDGEDIKFWGTGRWAFDRCLEDLDWFFNTEKNPVGKEIIEYYEGREDGALSYEFVDEEAGCGVLYEARGTSYTTEHGLHFTQDDYTDYDYTNGNLVALGFYDCYFDDVDSAIKEIEKYVGAKLTDEMIEEVKEEFDSPRCGRVFLEYDIDELVYKFEKQGGR